MTEVGVWLAQLLIVVNLFPSSIDIDECTTDQNRCDQSCSNTDGSYTCSCLTSFTLDGDGFTCNGIFNAYK